MSLRVLVIDDEAIVRMAVTTLLKLHRYTVETAADGDEGAALAKSIKPDVILCDSRMPKYSGLQTVAQLRNDPETAGIPVIIMSGHETKQSTVYADGFIPKPFGVMELLNTVKAVARQKKGD